MKQSKLVLFLTLMLSLFIAGCQASSAGTQASESPTGANMPTLETHAIPSTDPNADIIATPSPQADTTPQDGELLVRALNVRHGDATLVVTPDGKTMLIDTGDASESKLFKKGLVDAGVERIDILLLTHPHTDHIGNASWVLKNYPVGEVHMIDKEHTTQVYTKLLDTLEETGVPVKLASPGVRFDLSGSTSCEYLAPLHLKHRGLNNDSAVLKMTFGQTTFLFTGDLEVDGETELLEEYTNNELKADYLKVGHHATSSTQEAFAKAVSPTVATISSLPLKSYASPEKKQAIIDRLRSLGCEVYTTGENGTISVYSDGAKLRTEQPAIYDGIEQDKQLKTETPTPVGELATDPL